MPQITACRACLAENLNMYRVTNSPYKEIYEKLTNAKLGMVYPDTFCYICVSILHKFRKFSTLARNSNAKLQEWYSSETERKPATQPLFIISTTAVEYVSTLDENRIQEKKDKIQIKMEKIDNTIGEKQTIQFIESTGELYRYESTTRDDSMDIDTAWSDDEPEPKPIVKLESRKLVKTEKTPKGVPVNKKFKRETLLDDHINAITKPQENQPHTKQYSCDICLKAYNTKTSLQRHEMSHNKDKQFNCDHCDKRFNEKAALKRHHLTKHYDKPPLVCQHCFIGAVNKDDLHSHMNNHTLKWKEYICDYCNYKNADKKKLELHIMNKHLRAKRREKIYPCDLCDYKTYKKSWLRRHIDRIHLRQKNYFSEVCGYRAFTESSILKHSIIDNEDKTDQEFKCQDCNKTFLRKTSLALHMRVHTGERPYKCEICDNRFTQLGDLKSHITYIHQKQKRNYSYQSTVITSSNSTVEEQKNVGLVYVRDKPFSCDQCDFKCADKCGVKRHIARKHSTEKAYLCHKCNYSGKTSSYLAQHLKSHEAKDRSKYKHACKDCDKKFRHLLQLNEHRTTHTGEKPNTCPQCDQKFTKKSALRGHIRYIHEKQERKKVFISKDMQSFNCDSCDFKCACKRGLSRHILRMHVREKLFMCHKCDYRCVFESDLKKHIARHKD